MNIRDLDDPHRRRAAGQFRRADMDLFEPDVRRFDQPPAGGRQHHDAVKRKRRLRPEQKAGRRRFEMGHAAYPEVPAVSQERQHAEPEQDRHPGVAHRGGQPGEADASLALEHAHEDRGRDREDEEYRQERREDLRAGIGGMNFPRRSKN